MTLGRVVAVGRGSNQSGDLRARALLVHLTLTLRNSPCLCRGDLFMQQLEDLLFTME